MIIKRILLFAAIMVFCPLLDAQTIDDLVKISASITGFPNDRKLLPCWGEKITYKKD